MIFIIVSAYNAQSCLKNAVNSVITQKYTDWKMILVNDGSTDDTLNICEKYAKQDSRIFVINQNNTGQFEARLNGYKFIKNLSYNNEDYIAFLDADDVFYDENSLQNMIDASRSGEADIVCAQHSMVSAVNSGTDKTESHYILKNEEYFEDSEEIKKRIAISFFGEHYIYNALWAKLFKVSLFEKVNEIEYFPKRYGEDLFVNMHLFLNADTVSITTKKVYKYVQGGLTSKFMPYYFDDIVKIHCFRKECIDKYNLPEEYSRCTDFQTRSFFHNWILMCYRYRVYKNEELVKEIKRCAEDKNISEILADEAACRKDNYAGEFLVCAGKGDYYGAYKEIKVAAKNLNFFGKVKNKLKDLL